MGRLSLHQRFSASRGNSNLNSVHNTHAFRLTHPTPPHRIASPQQGLSPECSATTATSTSTSSSRWLLRRARGPGYPWASCKAFQERWGEHETVNCPSHEQCSLLCLERAKHSKSVAGEFCCKSSWLFTLCGFRNDVGISDRQSFLCSVRTRESISRYRFLHTYKYP